MCTLFRVKMTRGIDSRGYFRSKRIMWPGKMTTPFLSRCAKFQIFEFVLLLLTYIVCTLFRYKKPREIDSNGPFLSRRVVWPGKSTTPIYQDAWNFKFSNFYYCCLQLLCVHYSAIKRPNKSIGMVNFLSRRLVWPGNLPHRPHIFIGWKVYPLHSSTIRFIKRFRITL